MDMSKIVATVRMTDPTGDTIPLEDIRAAIEKALRNPDAGLYGMSLRVTVGREGEVGL